MRFRMLGGTELVAAESPVSISSERQRRLLAALAMHCPDTVTAERLVDAVWPGKQPANAPSALATVVTRLRHSLEGQEAGASQLVVARPPGYLLNVPAEYVDANRFADLALTGRRHLAAGDLDAARRTLSEALRLWHGRPYAEFEDEPWARGEAQRLERLWVTTREADIEARLTAGLHAEVLGDIHQLIDVEPYSDGPRGLLMRALFASGRQTEAVRAFQDYRRLLTEEAGLEPGPELVALERRILDNDPTLLTPAGQALRGYRLHEQLETTERGAVFRATQPGLERSVAIEVIREDIADDADFVRSFELEGRALAQLDHAHVAPIYDCWREPGGAYLVRRLLSGGSLADPAVQERLGPEGLARARVQARSALDVAHQAGLVHGPIEARDVQLDDHDTAYLANFRLGAGEVTREDDIRSFDRLFDALVGPTQDSDTPTAPPRVTSPYRGLAPFQESDVDVFFGRARLVEATLATIERCGTAFVVGPSGSGKSSLVRAGVIPALSAGELEGSEDWFVATMVPAVDPFEELEAAVLRLAVHPPAGLRDQLRDPDHHLAEAIQRILPGPSACAVLVIDQFEELFTLTPDTERQLFLEKLGDTMRDHRSRLRVIATLRADFYDQPLAHPEIASVVTTATVPVDALSGDELRDAIVEPARVVGIDVEPALVGRLVSDAAGRPGALPLVEFTLSQLFEKRHSDALTLDAYLDSGGLTAAIGSRAEEIYGRLDSNQRRIARRLFGRLVAVEAATDTRRRVPVSELRSTEEDPDSINEVADPFVKARLLLTDRDENTREPTLEVAHEALFREWPRLATWISDDRATIETTNHLSVAARRWRSSDDDSELYRGARLAAATDLATDHGDRLTADEQAFVRASMELADSEHRRERRANRRLRGLLVAAGVLLLAAITAGLVANRERSRADDRATEAERQATRASEAAGAEADAARAESAARSAADLERLTAVARSTGAIPQEVAILAALEAHQISPSPDTLNALHWAVTSNPGYRGTIGDRPMGGDLTLLDDGRRIVTHTSDTIEIWDVPTRTRDASWPFPGASEVGGHASLRSTASSDGRLVVAGAPGVTTVIDAQSGEAVATIPHPVAAVGVALSPDDRLAIALDDGTVEVRELADPAEPVAVRTSGDAAPELSWHPDGLLALGTTSGDVVLWDPDANEDIWAFEEGLATGPPGADTAPALLFSSDGDRLVVAGLEDPDTDTLLGSRVVWLSASDGRVLGATTTNMSGIRSLSWLDSHETTVVVSSLNGSNVLFVNLDDPAAIPRLRVANFDASIALPAEGLIVTEAGLGLDIHSVDESNRLVRRVPLPPNTGSGGSLFSTFLDETGSRLLAVPGLSGAHIIDLGGPGAAWEPFVGPDGESITFAISARDGRRLLTAGGRGFNTRDWDGVPLTEPAPVPDGGIGFIRMSPDGERAMLTIADEDILFELDPQLRETERLPPLTRPAVCCATPSFSTDGALFSRLDREGGTELFDATTGEQIPFEHDVEAQLFGPRGTWFAAVDDRGTIRLHDQQTGEQIGRPMVGNRGPIVTLLPTSDQRRVAAIGADGTTRVWDLETTTQVGRPIQTTHPGYKSWSTDGRYLSVYHVGDDGIGRIEVWNFDTQTWPETACDLAGRNLTEAEWQQYGPRTIERRATCPEFPL